MFITSVDAFCNPAMHPSRTLHDMHSWLLAIPQGYFVLSLYKSFFSNLWCILELEFLEGNLPEAQ